MKKQAVFMIIVLVVSVMVGWDFQKIAMAAEQPEAVETAQPEMDNDAIYSAEEGDDADPAGDEEVVSGGDAEEGGLISPDGEVEGAEEE